MPTNTAYVFDPIEEIDEQDEFLRILYHDARGGNAIRMLLGAEEDSKPYVNHFANRSYLKIGYRSTKYNAYASLNTFSSYRRVADQVYNYSGIFIDLDAHDFKSEKEMDNAIIKTQNRLRKAYKRGEISVPTMITHSGRGMGIFYVLDHSISNTKASEKSIKYLEHVRNALTARYKKLLEGTGIEVDSKVKDGARVVRMPLTLNKKCNRWCRLIFVNYDDEGEVQYCDLSKIAAESHLFDEIAEVRRHIASRKVVALDEYKLPFLTIRMRKLELLQELRGYDCSGYREYMLFIYYNAAKQVHGIDNAIEATELFNGRFLEPLANSELEHIYSVVDKNVAPAGNYEGYYRLPDSYLIDTLEVSDLENAKCKFGQSKKEIERQIRKESNASRREERNREIADYLINNPAVTYPEAAIIFGVSESMIYRICKQFDIKRHNMTLADEITDSPALEEIAHENGQSLQKVPESLLGVSSTPVFEGAVGLEEESSTAMSRRIWASYVELYGDILSKRVIRSQIPGQFGFRLDENGNVDYYLIS